MYAGRTTTIFFGSFIDIFRINSTNMKNRSLTETSTVTSSYDQTPTHKTDLTLKHILVYSSCSSGVYGLAHQSEIMVSLGKTNHQFLC